MRTPLAELSSTYLVATMGPAPYAFLHPLLERVIHAMFRTFGRGGAELTK